MFNIDNILGTMKQVLLAIFSEKKPAVVKAVDGYIADAKIRLGNLAEGALSGELSYKFVTERLKEEPVNIKDQLLSVGEIIAADIEQVVNRAVAVFEGALKDSVSNGS